MQLVLVQAPLCLVVDERARRRVRRPPDAVDGAVQVEQLVQQALRRGQNLLRKFVYEVLGELLQLRLVQSGERLGDGRSQADGGGLIERAENSGLEHNIFIKRKQKMQT